MKVDLKLKRLPETDEWRVSVFIDGKYSEEKSYYTDDKQDAIDTMEFMKKEFESWSVPGVSEIEVTVKK